MGQFVWLARHGCVVKCVGEAIVCGVASANRPNDGVVDDVLVGIFKYNYLKIYYFYMYILDGRVGRGGICI